MNIEDTAGGGAATLTSAPIESSAAGDAEFIDITGAKARWALGRSTIYDAIALGEIKSISLRRKGRLRGKRLLNVASIKSWLASQPTDVDPQLSRNCHKANLAAQEAKKAKKEAEEKARQISEAAGARSGNVS